MKYIKIKIYILVSLFPILMSSQTYVGLSFGRNYTFNEGERLCALCRGEGFSNNSWFYGLVLEQYIGKKIKLSINSSFTKKAVKYDRFYVPDYLYCDSINNIDFKYKQINSFAMVYYSLIKGWSVGAGFGMRYFYNGVLQRIFDGNREVIKYNNSQTNFDWTIGTSYNYRNIIFGIKYSQGIAKKKQMGFGVILGC